MLYRLGNVSKAVLSQSEYKMIAISRGGQNNIAKEG